MVECEEALDPNLCGVSVHCLRILVVQNFRVVHSASRIASFSVRMRMDGLNDII